MTDNVLLAEWSADVLYLTLHRPARLNALNAVLLRDLAEHLRAVEPTTTAVVLRGAGRAFCSGYDLKEAAAQGRLDTAGARATAERMQAVAVAMRECPAPIITQVHGYAIGGGAEIALSGDIVIAAADCVVRFTEASVGRVVTNGFTNLLPRTVGPVRAKSLLLLGRPITGAQAYAWGLVTEAVDPNNLDQAVADTVDALRAQSRWAVAAAKRLVDRGLQASFEASLDLEVGAAIEAELGADAETAATTFATS